MDLQRWTMLEVPTIYDEPAGSLEDRFLEDWGALQHLLENITWMPNARFELDRGPSSGTSFDIMDRIVVRHDDLYHVGLLVHLKVRDTYNPTGPELIVTHRRPLPILKFPLAEMAALQLIRRVFHQVVTHESDEWFRVYGRMIFDPHKER